MKTEIIMDAFHVNVSVKPNETNKKAFINDQLFFCYIIIQGEQVLDKGCY